MWQVDLKRLFYNLLQAAMLMNSSPSFPNSLQQSLTDISEGLYKERPHTHPDALTHARALSLSQKTHNFGRKSS